jgi:DMSO/TMAO reductase YedYZ molybdopterin-dependent catalytic subunit
MPYPWVNILLLGLLFLQLATGYFGFTSGRFPHRWILWLHGIGAYMLILLFYWKSSVIVGALRRKKKWSGKRLGFAAATVLLAATLIAGLLWSLSGPIYVAGFSLVSIHIYLAVPLILLLLWHSWHMRFIFRVSRTHLARRLFLRSAASSVAGFMLWRTAGLATNALGLPGSRRRFTGSYEWAGTAKGFPTVSWIADRPAAVNLDFWRLVIEGEVKRPLSLTYGQLLPLATDVEEVTLDCTGGWYSTQTWRGIKVARLLDIVGVDPQGESVTFRAVSGYQRRFSLADARNYLLALGVAGEALSHGHGFPLRLVAPDQRGVNWVKWITHIQINAGNELWQLPLPLQ